MLPDVLSAVGERAALDYLAGTAAGAFYLYVPVAAAYVTFGRPVLDAVLGGSLSEEPRPRVDHVAHLPRDESSARNPGPGERHRTRAASLPRPRDPRGRRARRARRRRGHREREGPSRGGRGA